MKAVLRFIVVSSIPILSFAQASDSKNDEIAPLLGDIMPPVSLRETVEIIREPGKFSQKQITFAQERVEKAKLAVRKLRPMIKVGNGILDYPGLLTRGEITYVKLDDKGRYSLNISAGKEGHLGVADPNGFVVVFDDRGLIIAVSDPMTEAN